MKSYSRAKYTSIAVLLTASFLLSMPVQATLVGSTPGNFSVSQSGAANYSIAIQVPPGIAGMEPKLSFQYDSQFGNGLLGLGWGLTGLSEIRRCPQTLAQDGIIDGIDLDQNDKYCLDGQRLVQTATGSDGYGSYTQYRTEIDTFSRIRSYGTGSGPDTFRVWTRSGQYREYGVTVDSRIEAQGKTAVLVWALNKVMDTSGNYMTFSYVETNANGEFHLSRIDYTGNASQSITPYASIQFDYQVRPDIVPAYLAGSLLRTTERLTHVRTYINTTLVKDYRLSYEVSGATNKSLLTGIEECDGQTPTSQCLPATVFTNEPLPTGAIDAGVSNSPKTAGDYSAWPALTGDFNADGLADVLWYRNTSLNGIDVLVSLSNGNGTLQTGISSHVYNLGGSSTPLPGDYNGDGLTDMAWAWAAGSGASALISLSNGDGSMQWAVWNRPITSGDYSAWKIVSGDFNGDGLTDIAWSNSTSSGTQALIALSSGNGTLQTGISSSVSTTGDTAWTLLTGEFNGDGLTDIAWSNSNSAGTRVMVSLSNGDGTLQQLVWNAPTASGDSGASMAADFNGDGLSDVLWYRNTSLNGIDVLVSLSKGNGTMQTGISSYVYSLGSSSTPLPGDYNGDGLTDMAWAWAAGSGTSALISLSSGDGAMQWAIWSRPTTSGDYSAWKPASGDFNGDGVTDITWTYGTTNSGTRALVALANTSSGPPLREIQTGLGAETAITYKPLTDSSVYTKGANAVYPKVAVQNSIYVVSQVNADNGIGGMRTRNYSYDGLKADYGRRGMLGFAFTTMVDAGTGIKTISSYYHNFPYTGLPYLVERKKSNNVLISSTQYAYDEQSVGGLGLYNCSPASGIPVECVRVEKTYDFDSGSLLTTVTTGTAYDSYNNPDLVTVTTVGNAQTFHTEIDNTFTNDTTNWRLGLLERSVVEKTHPDTSTATQVVEYDYDSSTGLLLREIVEPDSTNPNIRLTTAYVRDGFGNIVRTTLCDGAITPANCDQNSTNARSTQTSYTSNHSSYPNGLFVTGVTNALNQSETRVYDVRFGTITGLTGPNGLTTAWGYDSLGRKTLESRADGTQTAITYANCTSCPTVGSTAAKYTVTTTTTGMAPTTVYFDAFGREIRKRTTYDGTNYAHVDTRYDARGRVGQVSEPYFSGNAPVWTVYEYDALDRVIELDPAHTAAVITTDYDGFGTAVTDAEGRIKTEVKNAIGQVISVTEADGTADEVTTVYRYDASGNLEETEVNADDATIIHMDYDVRGRKTAMDDPDMGAWSYAYNAFGELVSQTDAKGQVTEMEYDKLGRMIERVEDATGSPETSTFTFGTSATNKNVGKLTGMSGPGGSSTSYVYDGVGRPSQTTYNIDTASFVVSQSYDGTTGMPIITTYPSTAKYSSGFQLRRVYNSSGALTRVETTDTTPFVFWQADASNRNARGQVEEETLGNGIDTVRVFNEATGWLEATQSVNSSFDLIHHAAYTYDDLGNLLTRTDYRPDPDIVESFTYDHLNRMATSQRTGESQKTYTYNALGNLTGKAGVSYSYTGCGGRPHAVCSAGGNSYSYDANGNVTSSAGRSVTYSPSNFPVQFTQGGMTASFSYDAERNRILKVSGDLRVRYVGMTGTGNPLFEQEYNSSSGNKKNIHYIYADGPQAVAQHIAEGTGTETEYFHRDHLGSVEAISDDSGLLSNMVYLNYDAFGDRVLGPNVRQGFTGHETITEVGLVHMNGRVYDPVLGRFLSSDPFIPDPFASQSYNRYSYVSNNPLSLADPNGYDPVAFYRPPEHLKNINGWVDPKTGVEYPIETMIVYGRRPDSPSFNTAEHSWYLSRADYRADRMSMPGTEVMRNYFTAVSGAWSQQWATATANYFMGNVLVGNTWVNPNLKQTWEPVRLDNPYIPNSEKREMVLDAQEVSKQGRIEESLSIFPNQKAGSIGVIDDIDGFAEGWPATSANNPVGATITVWSSIVDRVYNASNPHFRLEQTQEQLRGFYMNNLDAERVCLRCHTDP